MGSIVSPVLVFGMPVDLDSFHDKKEVAYGIDDEDVFMCDRSSVEKEMAFRYPTKQCVHVLPRSNSCVYVFFLLSFVVVEIWICFLLLRCFLCCLSKPVSIPFFNNYHMVT